MYRAIRAFSIFLLLVVVVGIAFFAGIMVSRQGLLPVTGMIDVPGGGATAPDAGKVDMDLIDQASQIIRQHYADRETLNETNLTYGALTGMVDALGDTGHSRFMTPEMVETSNRSLSGEFDGIGAMLNVNDEGNPVILAPFDNSPAQRAGLKPGDIIIAVDGVDVSHASLTEVVDRVTGPAGTQVTLTIRDPETLEDRDVTITREKIVVKNVTWQMLPETNIAHVRIAQFSQDVDKDLVNALNEAQDQGAKGILLDLRNNPGGLLDEAIGVVSQFLTEGYALQIKNADGKVTNVPLKRGGVATDIPMVVLINQGSASAAEITAGALQDYQRATLVGETTFGTGTVLNRFGLPDGSALLLATELWLTPKGRVIWHQGISPDETVSLPAEVSLSTPETERQMTAQDLQNTEDTQLKRGVELLTEKIK